ncbi:MAG: Mbeg1-like protein [[Clostridium] innocuum]
MSNLFDYLTWRNDLTFSTVPCCAVDTLICSCLSYLRLQPVFAIHRICSMSSVLLKLSRAINPEEIHFRVKEDLQLLHKMAEGNRYGNVILCGYVDHLDPSMEKQFYALTCLLEDDVMLITYRGTDNTLVGWKEDFNMTFLDTIPSQKEAVQYLEAMAAAYPESAHYPMRTFQGWQSCSLCRCILF